MQRQDRRVWRAADHKANDTIPPAIPHAALRPLGGRSAHHAKKPAPDLLPRHAEPRGAVGGAASPASWPEPLPSAEPPARAMATATYLRRAGGAPASGSVFETLALEPLAATAPAPRPAPRTSDAGGRNGSHARCGPLQAEDQEGVEMRRAGSQGVEIARAQAARAAAAARAERAARAAPAQALREPPAGQRSHEPTAPASQELLDAVARLLGSASAHRAGVPPKGAKQRPLDSDVPSFDRCWSLGSTDGGSGSSVGWDGASPTQTEDQLPAVGLCA
ncbi:unnamed protein product [Prorocentrum cordatum]|uniref:Uncharacterized protein n=1 Tax=Prorocentrum cordatum TaxID=2364126 RepID=A0ABN9XIZ1_9DINO|nr:unnamed protein product [Polarella glacialis]